MQGRAKEHEGGRDTVREWICAEATDVGVDWLLGMREMERSREVEDSSLSCWGSTRVARSLRGNRLDKKTNTWNLGFLRRALDQMLLKVSFWLIVINVLVAGCLKHCGIHLYKKQMACMEQALIYLLVD